jgi:hypothetical protein
MITLFDWLTVSLQIYLAAGALFALPFVGNWVGRIDPSARGGTLGFRLVILPGVIALWPLLLRRLLTGRAPQEHNPHEEAGR